MGFCNYIIMSNLTLDGSTSFIGTEFIKLLATGSSNLATEEYVDDAIERGGGGGNVDLSNYYTQTEIDALLNNKLNVNNPQDVIGNLRLDPTNGLSKIILNAVNAPNDEDFYVNGNSYINGEMRASSMKCDNTLQFATIKGNFISHNDANTDLKFQINSNDFITLSTANDVIEVDKDIGMHSSVLKSDVLDTWSNASLQIRRNGTNYLSLDGDDTISISRQSKISSNKADGVDMTVSHHNNTTNLFEKKFSFKNGNEIFATGDGGADEELLLNYYTDAGVRIGNATESYLTIRGARNGTDTLTVNGSTYFGGAVSYNGDIVLTNPYQLKTNNISTNGLNDLVFNVETLGEFLRCQVSDLTVRVPNNRSFLSQDIIVDNIQPLAFGNDVVFNGGNSTNDAYEEYIRLDASTERVDFNKTIEASEDIVLLPNNKLYLDTTASKNRYIRSSLRSGTPSFEQLDIINESSGGRIRLILDANGSNTTDEQFIVENSGITCRRILKAGQGLDTNTIDTNTDVNLTFSRNGNESLRLDKTNDNITCSKEIVAGGGIKNNTFDSDGDSDVLFTRDDIQFMALDKFTEDTVEKEAIICSKQLRANGNILVNNLQINQFSVGVQYADFRLENADSVVRFFVGNGTNVNLQITHTGITLNRETTISSVKTNTIDTTNDSDLIFRRNGVEYFRLDDLTGTDILNVANDKGVSASYVFGNRFWNRSFSSDTTFFGSNVAGDDRVEYMKWNYLSQSVDYNAPIDNTGLAITGNIIDTTVSDERLKTNIEDVDTDFTSCIKNVKVKTFKYKDDKYKTNDTYGFIAQELKEHLPKECKNIVKENKVKHEDETFLSINYMKLSVVLWKCCQEQQSKIEHLEASMYEIINEIKELKGKKTTKPKSKAKAKSEK